MDFPVIILITVFLVTCSWGLPVLDVSSGINNDTIEERRNLNDTPKNLYVVRAVVYEIGILTEADENDTSFESQERVDLTFFDAHSNESHIDLGNVPLPIQTNVSGQVFTGIAPVNIGAFSSPTELLSTLPLTGTIVNITHSDTAFYTLTKTNASSAEKPHIVEGDDLSHISNATSLFSSLGILGTQEKHRLQQQQHEKDSEPSNSLDSSNEDYHSEENFKNKREN